MIVLKTITLMKSVSFGLILSLLACTIETSAQTGNEDWKLAKDKEGIQVYTRIAEDSKFKEFKSMTRIAAPAAVLLEVFKDADKYTEWMAHIKKASLVEKISENEFYAYSELGVPWPFDNRDNITKSVVSYNPETEAYTVDIAMVPDYLPENKGIVRIQEGGGQWVFKPMGDSTTEVFHRFFADPSGNIPAWIVNMFIVDGPFKTLIAMRDRVEKAQNSEEPLVEKDQ
jgi:hypothetical protein